MCSTNGLAVQIQTAEWTVIVETFVHRVVFTTGLPGHELLGLMGVIKT